MRLGLYRRTPNWLLILLASVALFPCGFCVPERNRPTSEHSNKETDRQLPNGTKGKSNTKSLERASNGSENTLDSPQTGRQAHNSSKGARRGTNNRNTPFHTTESAHGQRSNDVRAADDADSALRGEKLKESNVINESQTTPFKSSAAERGARSSANFIDVTITPLHGYKDASALFIVAEVQSGQGTLKSKNFGVKSSSYAAPLFHTRITNLQPKKGADFESFKKGQPVKIPIKYEPKAPPGTKETIIIKVTQEAPAKGVLYEERHQVTVTVKPSKKKKASGK